MRRILSKRSQLRLAAGIAATLAGYAWLALGPDAGIDEAGRIEALFASRTSGEVVESSGTIKAVLPDDNKGSRHQRFIVRLASDHTVLVSHNIDLAPRVANLERGHAVAFRGQYEWNERGGVVHWTHHDPQGRRPGGWIEHRGERYR